MNDSDRGEFLKYLLGLKMAHREREPLSEMEIEFYWQALKPYPLESVKEAFNDAARGLKFFPKIAELIELVEGGSGDDKARMAWVALMKCVGRHGYWDSVEFPEELADIIEGLFGGWQKLSELTWEDLKYREREFVSMYKARCGKRFSGNTRVLTGQIDQSNISRGFQKDITGPVKFLEKYGAPLGLPYMKERGRLPQKRREAEGG